MGQSDFTSRTTARLTDLVTGPLLESGYDLEDIDLSRAGKRSVLRIAVDRDGGVDLDHIAEVTREVSTLLDDSDVMGEAPYTLEVSSRGVERPLTLPRHWRRNAGRLVAVARNDAAPIEGRIKETDDTGVVLTVDDADVRVEYADVTRATIQIEFTREG